MNTCEECGDPITTTRKGVRYCGRSCSNKAFHKRRQASGRKQSRTLHTRTCLACGKTWTTEKATASYCSNACIIAGRFGPDRNRNRGPMTERMRRARRAQRRAVRGTSGKGIVWTQGPCGWCREEFLSRTAAGSPARYCSRDCKRRAIERRHKHRRRDAYVADVSPAAVFVRDGYRCHICRRRTDPTKVVPHPRAPTIDHLIPLSLGGTHEPANVATACFLCNSTKGAVGAGDQLALIG